ncbi:hypothetical protein HME9302_00587 [Alteripontixanthobacter maritimus]|uniref:Nucleoid-associated protein n=1 Tax=Alteripontixanthobacter maritimus TaxID=2161824 RepID=A0A369Q8Z8_9SPHN|nr:nucleoid-associated protein [Alteripontixanthobacter maritimus]RDC59399.1 hypothetical protein HME9302_00587 [Alteripontixanthobacter maritimus]
MSFITDEDAASLRIESMILHVVGDDEFRPEPAREVEHEEFFIERIREADVAAVFAFEDGSQTKAQIERMAKEEDTFEEGGQALSRDFARLHPGSSRDGAFFIFELRTDDPTVRIYCLIKYDYEEAIEQRNQDGVNLLRLIVQAFVADKRAIQKFALIRTIDGVAEQTLAARDRMKQAPEIGDYFANYLHVRRVRDNRQLTEKAVRAVSDALKELRELLPNRDVALAFRQVKTMLGTRNRIDEAAVQEAVLAAAGHPEEERTVGKIQNCVRRKVRVAKLEGLEFPPVRELLQAPALRRLKTAEGVSVTYPDRVGQTNVDRQERVDGGEIITITTRRIEEDDIVRLGSRN